MRRISGSIVEKIKRILDVPGNSIRFKDRPVDKRCNYTGSLIQVGSKYFSSFTNKELNKIKKEYEQLTK